MAYTKRVWKGRQGTGLNKFSIDGATPVTVVNQPDSLIEAGDALSAGNLNDLETRIDDAFNAVDAEVATKADETEVTDLKNALTAVDHRVQNLEQAKGDYVAVDSDKGVIAVPSGKGKWAVVEKLRGVSRAKNNICYNPNFADGTSYWAGRDGDSVSVSDGVLTVTASSGTLKGLCSDDSYYEVIAGHKYLVSGYVKSSISGVASLAFSSFSGTHSISANQWSNVSRIIDQASNADISIYFLVQGSFSGGETIQYKNIIVTDLTLYFGSTVPTLAEIQTYYPWLLEPSDYGNSLVDSVYEGVKSEGVNIWDEQWEMGSIDGTTGADTPSSSLFRSKNFIPVLPQTEYFSNTRKLVIYEYDINGNFIGSVSATNEGEGYKWTNSANACYLKFRTSNYGSTTYQNNIQICLNSASDKTTYHPYMTDTLSLPTPITLRSAGSVAEEFDLESGEKTNPLGSYTFTGNENFYYSSGRFIWEEFYTTGAKAPSASSVEANATMAIYTLTTADNTTSSSYDKSFGISLYDALCVRDSSYDSSTLASFKSNLVGKKIYYELATPNAPTQLTPIANPTILTEAGGTISAQTEEPIDGNFSVGFITL